MNDKNFRLTKNFYKNKVINEFNSVENLNEYKGVFFGDDTEQIFYERGAHFKYSDLCNKLKNLLILYANNDERNKDLTLEKSNSLSRNCVNKEKIQSRNNKIVPGQNKLINDKLTHISTQTNEISFQNNNIKNKEIIRAKSNNKLEQNLDNMFINKINFFSTFNESKKIEEKYSNLNNKKINEKDYMNKNHLSPNLAKQNNKKIPMNYRPINKVNKNFMNIPYPKNKNFIENKKSNYENFMILPKEFDLRIPYQSPSVLKINTKLSNIRICKKKKECFLKKKFNKVPSPKPLMKGITSDFLRNLSNSKDPFKIDINIMENDLSKFEINQPNHIEINKSIKNYEAINFNYKSRNQINQKIGDSTSFKGLFSHSLKENQDKKFIKNNIFSETIQNKLQNNISNKKNTIFCAENSKNYYVTNNSLLHNYNNSNKIQLKMAISSSKISSNSGLSTNRTGILKTVKSTNSNFDINQSREKVLPLNKNLSGIKKVKIKNACLQ